MKHIRTYEELLSEELKASIRDAINDYRVSNGYSKFYVYEGVVEFIKEDSVNEIFLREDPKVNLIESLILQHYDSLKKDIYRKTRKREIIKIRQPIHFFLNVYTTLTLSAIGWNIGEKDHATVLHSCRTIMNLSAVYLDYREEIRTLDRMIINKLGFTESFVFNSETGALNDWISIKKRKPRH